MENLRFLRAIFSDIIAGRTSLDYRTSTIYIKHLSYKEQSYLDSFYQKFYDESVASGLQTQAVKLEDLHKEGLWTDEDETKLKNTEKQIRILDETRRALFLPSQTRQVKEQIEIQQAFAGTLLTKKFSLIGTTCESYTNKKLNDLHTFHSIFKDLGLTIPLFTRLEFDEMEDDELEALFNRSVSNFKDANIKKLALCNFAQNMYDLCQESCYSFYGRAVVELTYYQSELYVYLRYFNSILKKRPPVELLGDAEKLEMWETDAANFKKNLEKFQSGSVGIMGATKEDLEFLGADKQTGPDLIKLTKEKGGLSFQDMLRAHGEKI